MQIYLPIAEVSVNAYLLLGLGGLVGILSGMFGVGGGFLMTPLLFFIGSLSLVPYIPTALFDSGNTDLATISMELPPGSTLEKTEQLTGQVTQTVLANEATESIFISQSPGDASGYVQLKPKNERVHRSEFEENMRGVFQTIPGARINFQAQGAGGGGKALEIVLTGEDPDLLTQAAQP